MKASLPHWGLSLSPSVLLQHRSESYMLGTSLVGQWLRIQAFTTGGIGSGTKFPSGRTKTLYATQCSQKKKKKSTNVFKKVKKKMLCMHPLSLPRFNWTQESVTVTHFCKSVSSSKFQFC